jgi:uncharacterized YigZ family protein
MSADHFLTLAAESFGEVREKGSKFLAFAFPVPDEKVFKVRLAAIAKEHHTARHICYAWVLGEDGGRFRAFDAGEPAGSAGKPILRHLQGEDLTFCALVVVRYFGGTLLGKAGLAHAFADAAQAALAANTMVRRTVLERLEIQCGYAVVEEIKRQVLALEGMVEQAEYGAQCNLRVAVPRSQVESLCSALKARGIVARPQMLGGRSGLI